MGGRLALAAACQACAGEPPASSLPFSMLVLESAGLGPASPAEREEMARRNAENARRLREEGLAAFMEAWEQLPLFATQRALPADVRQRQRDQRLANDAEALARTFEGSGAHTMPDQEASLATIRALVAYGVPVRYVAALWTTSTARRPTSWLPRRRPSASGARGGPQRPPGGRRRLRAPAGGHRLCAAVTATDVAHRAFFWRCDALPARGCASHRQVWRYRCATGPRGCRRRAPAGRILPGGGSRGTRGCPARGLPTCPRRHRGD